MGRSVFVVEQVRSSAPELARALTSVHVAETEQEREAVFGFRHSVYVEELGRGVGVVDRRRRWLRDPEDDQPGTVLLFTAGDDGEINGTARVRYWSRGETPQDVRSRYSLDRFDGLDQVGVGELGRVMLAADHRGGVGLQPLIGAAYKLAVSELDVDVFFLTCLSGLVGLYRSIGFQSYTAPLVPTVDGLTVPLVLPLSDRAQLQSARSFLLPLVDVYYGPGRRAAVEVGRWSSLFEGELGPLELDGATVWDRLRQCSEHADPGAQFLRALGESTVRKLVSHGFLMNVEAGQVLTRQGLVQQELFVIIDGRFESHQESRRLRLMGPGEVIGEVGFFGTARRRGASVTAVSDGQVLVLRRRWLDQLRESEPRAAADILFQLARVLADRVYAQDG